MALMIWRKVGYRGNKGEKAIESLETTFTTFDRAGNCSSTTIRTVRISPIFLRTVVQNVLQYLFPALEILTSILRDSHRRL
jgi:hypothetical protein